MISLKKIIEEKDLYIESRFMYWLYILLGICLIVVGSIKNPTRTQSKFVKYDLKEDINDGKIRVTVTFGNKQQKFDIDSASETAIKDINMDEKTIKIEYDPNNEENFAYFPDRDLSIYIVWIFIILGIILLLFGLVSLWMDNNRFDPIDLGFVNFMNIFDYQ